MRKLIFALAAAGLVTFNVSGYSAEDSTIESRPDLNIPARTIEEGTVKTSPDPSKPGRSIKATVKSMPTRTGRAVPSRQAPGMRANEPIRLRDRVGDEHETYVR